MKREKAVVDSRQKEIVDILRASKFASVEDLSSQLGVSKMTIRRDLAYLDKKKILERTHGGAKYIYDANEELRAYRQSIAKMAASFVEVGDSFFINTSSNAIEMLGYISKKRVTVITNNGKAIYMEKDKYIDVILTGGELRRQKDAMVGDFAVRNLSQFYAKKAFIGCSGISAQGGVTTEIFAEVNINEMMIEHATKEVFVLADHTKIGKNSSFMSVPIDKIQCLITDEKADKAALEAIRKEGVRVIQVNMDE